MLRRTLPSHRVFTRPELKARAVPRYQQPTRPTIIRDLEAEGHEMGLKSVQRHH